MYHTLGSDQTEIKVWPFSVFSVTFKALFDFKDAL